MTDVLMCTQLLGILVCIFLSVTLVEKIKGVGWFCLVWSWEIFIKDGSHSKGEITPWWALGRSPWNQCHLVRICAPRVAFCLKQNHHHTYPNWQYHVSVWDLSLLSISSGEVWIYNDPEATLGCRAQLRAACSAFTTGYNALTHLTRGYSSYMRWGHVACRLLWQLRWWCCQWKPTHVNVSWCFLSEHVSRKALFLLVSQVTVGPTWFFMSEYWGSSHSGLYCWERLMHSGNLSFYSFSLSWWLTSWHWVCHTTFLEAFLCSSLKTRATDLSCIMTVFVGPTSFLPVISWAHKGLFWLPLPRLVRAHAYLRSMTYTLKSLDGGTSVMLLYSFPPFFMMEGDFPAAWSPESVGSKGSGYILCTWVSLSNSYQFLKLLIKQGCLLP